MAFFTHPFIQLLTYPSFHLSFQQSFQPTNFFKDLLLFPAHLCLLELRKRQTHIRIQSLCFLRHFPIILVIIYRYWTCFIIFLYLMFGLFKVKCGIQFIFVSLALAQHVTFKIHQSEFLGVLETEKYVLKSWPSFLEGGAPGMVA